MSDLAYPLTRITNLNTPVVAGYVTARLQASEALNGVSGYEPYQTQVLVENVGDASFTLQLQECADYSASGTRTNLGAATAVVPGGQKTLNVTPSARYLEVKSTSGNSEARIQLASRVKWNILGFQRNDPFYPNAILNSAGTQSTMV